jgi:hypothetical protein
LTREFNEVSGNFYGGSGRLEGGRLAEGDLFVEGHAFVVEWIGGGGEEGVCEGLREVTVAGEVFEQADGNAGACGLRGRLVSRLSARGVAGEGLCGRG